MDLLKKDLKDPDFARSFWEEAVNSKDDRDLIDARALLRKVLGPKKAAEIMQPVMGLTGFAQRIVIRAASDGGWVISQSSSKGVGRVVHTSNDLVQALNEVYSDSYRGKVTSIPNGSRSVNERLEALESAINELGISPYAARQGQRTQVREVRRRPAVKGSSAAASRPRA